MGDKNFNSGISKTIASENKRVVNKVALKGL